MNIYDLIQELKDIIKKLEDERFNYPSEEDKILKEYITQLEVVSASRKDPLPSEGPSRMRALVVSIKRLAEHLPLRLEEEYDESFLSFFSYFRQKESPGKLYIKICEWLDKTYETPEYKDAINVEKRFQSAKSSSLLDLSYLNITLEQFKKIASLTHLQTLNLTAIKIDGEYISSLDSKKFDQFVSTLGGLKTLVNLNLSSNLIGQRLKKLRGPSNPQRITKFGSTLADLPELVSLDLSYNNIQDQCVDHGGLTDFFSEKENRYPLNNKNKFPKLKRLNLAGNLLSFGKYNDHSNTHRFEDDDYKEQETILRRLQWGKIHIDLTCNYINFADFSWNYWDDKTGSMKRVPIVEKYPECDPEKYSATEIEGLLNPAYFVSLYKGVVVIADCDKNHAQILVHKMDQYRQLSLMKYHLTGGGDQPGIPVIRTARVKVKDFYTDYEFFTPGTSKCIYSKCFLVKKEQIAEMEREIKKHAKPGGLKEYFLCKFLYRCHTETNSALINCLFYCLSVINDFLGLKTEEKLTIPTLLIPTLALPYHVKQTPLHLSFSSFSGRALIKNKAEASRSIAAPSIGGPSSTSTVLVEGAASSFTSEHSAGSMELGGWLGSKATEEFSSSPGSKYYYEAKTEMVTGNYKHAFTLFQQAKASLKLSKTEENISLTKKYLDKIKTKSKECKHRLKRRDSSEATESGAAAHTFESPAPVKI